MSFLMGTMWAVITAMAMTYLLELLQQDPLILERPTVNCLSETPLHVPSSIAWARGLCERDFMPKA